MSTMNIETVGKLAAQDMAKGEADALREIRKSEAEALIAHAKKIGAAQGKKRANAALKSAAQIVLYSVGALALTPKARKRAEEGCAEGESLGLEITGAVLAHHADRVARLAASAEVPALIDAVDVTAE